MKTLLLVLAVVGFVDLVSGYVLICRKCNQTVCELDGRCAEGQNQCYIMQDKDDTKGDTAIQGCTTTCPTVEEDQKVRCCDTDYCNSYF